jgi:hypothetical protein
MRGKTYNRRIPECPIPEVAKAVIANVNYRQGSRFFKSRAEFEQWLNAVADKHGLKRREFAIGVTILIDEGWLRFTRTREGCRLNLAAPPVALDATESA